MRDFDRRLEKLQAAHGHDGIGAALDAIEAGRVADLDIHPALAALLETLPKPGAKQ